MLPLHPGGPDAAGGVTVLGCFSPGARSDPDTSSFLFSSNNLTVAPCSSHSLLHFLFSACLRGNVVRVGGAAADAQRGSPAEDALATPTAGMMSRTNFNRKLYRNVLRRLRKHSQYCIIYIWIYFRVKGKQIIWSNFLILPKLFATLMFCPRRKHMCILSQFQLHNIC